MGAWEVYRAKQGPRDSLTVLPPAHKVPTMVLLQVYPRERVRWQTRCETWAGATQAAGLLSICLECRVHKDLDAFMFWFLCEHLFSFPNDLCVFAQPFCLLHRPKPPRLIGLCFCWDADVLLGVGVQLQSPLGALLPADFTKPFPYLYEAVPISKGLRGFLKICSYPGM